MTRYGSIFVRRHDHMPTIGEGQLRDRLAVLSRLDTYLQEVKQTKISAISHHPEYAAAFSTNRPEEVGGWETESAHCHHQIQFKQFNPRSQTQGRVDGLGQIAETG